MKTQWTSNMSPNFKAFMVIVQTTVTAGIVGFGVWLASHIVWSLATSTLQPIEYDIMAAGILYPMAVVLVIALMDLRYIYQIANEE